MTPSFGKINPQSPRYHKTSFILTRNQRVTYQSKTTRRKLALMPLIFAGCSCFWFQICGLIQGKDFSIHLKDGEQLPFCTVHSDASSDAAPIRPGTLDLPALDAVPVIPKATALLGDDPYHTEMPNFASASTSPGMMRRRLTPRFC
jgi:hypothetical protein